MHRRFFHAAAVCPILLLAGCEVTTEHAGPSQYDSAAFERGSAEELHVDLRMGAGDLKIGTGTHKLAQAYFSYNSADEKPEAHFDAGRSATLTITQPESHRHVRVAASKYGWDVRLAEDIPLSLRVTFGAGNAQLDLGSLWLRDVTVEMGVGELEMDLRGQPKHDYNVSIHGGVGEATVRFPGNVGVSADASGGIGNIEARNLRGSHGHWVNEAFDHSPVHIHVNVEGGIGNIRLIGE
jgi:hypothetical protein